ncbi:MAG: hypothetical protein SAJ12_22695 [Jaaginema sp. PMC 1079.18]|nr:hypothetical protein [Jaaginema sp. PMC 1079.18]
MPYQPVMAFFLVFAIVLGVFFRFATLSGLVYWYVDILPGVNARGFLNLTI